MSIRIKRSEVSCYHCMSRTIQGRYLFHEVEKAVLRKMIYQVARFCGVRVLAYCVMSNHFHVLLETPGVDAVAALDDAELLKRYEALYGTELCTYRPMSVEAAAACLAEGGPSAERFRAWLRSRMGDISAYMRTLKLRFSIWYNRESGGFGTLWSGRFKSVLVEGAGMPLLAVAQYIDLNPVRAGLVKDPRDYRFCSYADARLGNAYALEGQARVMKRLGGSPEECIRNYQQTLKSKLGNDINKTEAMLSPGRSFCDGRILGSSKFVLSLAGWYGKLMGRRRDPSAVATGKGLFVINQKLGVP